MIRIIEGDARQKLAELPAESVHCCVTSPPYYGLRDYGTAQWEGGEAGCNHEPPENWIASQFNQNSHLAGLSGQSAAAKKRWFALDSSCRCGARRIDSQIGLEPSPDEYVAELVAVFRQVRRVLRQDGTLWLNLGDSYATSPAGNRVPSGISQSTAKRQATGLATYNSTDKSKIGHKPKDLLGIPWMVAFALRADGWYLRSDIIWSKPNPIPESVTDRPTKAHEYLFLLSKSERYFYDADAIAERLQTDPKENYPARATITGRGTQGAADARGNDRDKSGGFPPRAPHGQAPQDYDRLNARQDALHGKPARTAGNKSHKYVTKYEQSKTEEHRTKAGLKVADVPRYSRNKRSVWTVATAPYSEAHFATFPPALIEPCILAGCPEGGTVLDPFGGAGTTGLVADRLKRNAVLVELNPAYAEMARNRIRGDAPLLTEIA